MSFKDELQKMFMSREENYPAIVKAHQAEVVAILEGLKAKATNWGNGKDLIDPEDVDEAIRKAKGEL